MGNREPLASLTKCGIPGVGTIPFGLHLCHFFDSRQDFVDCLVHYFRAGLENNERCLWITAPPFPAPEAVEDLVRMLPGLAGPIREKRILIRGAEELFSRPPDREALRREEESALAEGQTGLRIAVTASSLAKRDWESFMAHEKAIHEAISGRRILAICSYDSRELKATDLFEVIQGHQHTLSRDGNSNSWQVADRAHGLKGRL